MGRHHCKVCCRSHELPQISNFKAEVDYNMCQHIQQSPCQLADLEPGSARRSPLELVVATNDFAEENVFTQVVIPTVVPEQTSGFWSRIFRGVGTNNEPIVIKVYKRQENYSQRQCIDRFHRELLALGTLGELHGFGKCIGFGFTADLWPYLVMEDCGIPIGTIFQKGKSVAPKPLALQLLSALEAMHLLGLCHCDIYEDNVLLTPGSSRLYDGMSSITGSYSTNKFTVRIVDWNSVQDCQLLADAGQAGKAASESSASDEEKSREGGLARHVQRLLVVEGKAAPSAPTSTGRRVAPLPPGREPAINGGTTEPLGAVRDCQGAGRIILKALDASTLKRVFGPQHLGTLDDWQAVASGVEGSRLKEPWKQALSLLFNPRALAVHRFGAAVPYPVPMARHILDSTYSSPKVR